MDVGRVVVIAGRCQLTWLRGPPRKLVRGSDDLWVARPMDVWKLWLVDTVTAFEYGRMAFELKTIGRSIGQNGIVMPRLPNPWGTRPSSR